MARSPITTSIALLAGLLVWVPSARALALRCVSYADVVPNAETRVVPSNTKIWIMSQLGSTEELTRGACLERPPTLRASDGAKVEVDLKILNRGLAVALPRAPLAVGATYTFEWSCASGLELPGDEPPRFTVTGPPDVTPPSAPRVTLGRGEGGVENDYGEYWYRRRINVETDGAVLLVDRELDAVLDLEAWTAAGLDHAGSNVTALGFSPCSLFNWPGASGTATQPFRFAALDLAGNVSGWGETLAISPEDPAGARLLRDVREGCGCEARAPDPRGLLLALGLLLTRRRRRD
ncbi:MAG: hypothetical protein H6713_13785 [Myxococcales bacterium]|nr:hypothetical protein [Myxococcales bacterium]